AQPYSYRKLSALSDYHLSGARTVLYQLLGEVGGKFFRQGGRHSTISQIPRLPYYRLVVNQQKFTAGKLLFRSSDGHLANLNRGEANAHRNVLAILTADPHTLIE